MTADSRRRRWYAMPVDWPHDNLGTRLHASFGNDGIAVWSALVAAAKRNHVEGTFTFATEEEAWHNLGLTPTVFTLEDFFRMTGRLKQTSKRRRGRVTDITLTRWEELQKTVTRSLEAERKARSRQRNARDIGVTDSDIDIDTDIDSDAPTRKQLDYLADLGYEGRPPASKREASKTIEVLTARAERKPHATPPRNDPATCPHLAMDDEGWCSACKEQVPGVPV